MFTLNAIIIIFFPETVGKPMVESIKELETEDKNEDKKSEKGIKQLNVVVFFTGSSFPASNFEHNLIICIISS